MSLAESHNTTHNPAHNIAHWDERVDLAAAFRWTERLNLHEGVANHFSVAVNDDGSQFLMNPNQMHFSRIKASDLLLLDANDPSSLDRPDAPDPTAWGLHGAVHRLCPHARCAMHVHPVHATVLASLADSTLPPIDQNTAIFFNRVAIDENYGGLAFEEEAERCCALLSDPTKAVLIMGNHGIMVIGRNVAETFNDMYYFERACETYITALMTGKPLRVVNDAVAEKTAQQWQDYIHRVGLGEAFLSEIRVILDREEPDYRL